MGKKAKDPNKLHFKDYLGTTIMGGTDGLAAGIMTGLFMLFLTDYAGIGKWGAVLGSALLVFARVFDAVNDPIEGWIMDRAKVGKYGKYRPFLFLSILLSCSDSDRCDFKCGNRCVCGTSVCVLYRSKRKRNVLLRSFVGSFRRNLLDLFWNDIPWI